uniref:Protein kinase domain-containing protein n=1 Tax=Alexandrium monilatum TaxID=311494 RepID=A0A7S4UJT6_9DINO|mmetsp:Transcript_35726/g.106755  ORF Transcript_35726/g.106755 Transcript_35726/m.106755 type:complete len:406 (-) Transcript_35726:36-1253(-)|eukprot:CAMPEP_0175216100 /NCGR_PEP_ID=MMETSP0093-20121207/17556_1 /TAXON_ID=311494 /ORGANISM="Alexandrium monilatum, Strain CCMP3105" /LENGTH=405 /DNA_ID=CAMNT_0016509489 /DNA_START=76 /DNA_END=1293 /DNA_ORIENTATION=+
MDYFAVGGRPLLSRFPPYLPGSFNSKLAEGPSEQGIPENLAVGGASSSAPEGQLGSAGSAGATGASSSAGEAVPSQAVRTPAALHSGFDPKEVRPWEQSRFEVIRKLQDATRNRGQVHLMHDITEDRLVAVKKMPNRWIRSCHSDFVIEHPAETEMPWQDVGCVQFLNSMGYPYACSLLGIYRDDAHTYVVTSFASEGDLFSWCEAGVAPGLEREVVVHPLARQMIEGMQQLHDFSIVHRDLSLENILLSKLEDESMRIRIIDFSMASTQRRFRNCVRGKASYQAPELHTDGEYDAFLTDAFSLGVTLYAVLLKDYPWLSTRPGGCKCFEYVRKHGFRSYLAKRKLRNSSTRVADVMSEPLKQLLEGMLAFDPADRLTLGEYAWRDSGRRSVWDEPWMHTGPGTV